MKCKFCHAKLESNHKFCPGCGRKLPINTVSNITTGTESINIGIGEGNVVQIDQFNNHVSHAYNEPEFVIQYKREKIIPLKLTSKGITVTGFFMAVLSVVSGIFTIMSFYGFSSKNLNLVSFLTNFKPLYMYPFLMVFLIGLALISISKRLRRKGFFRMNTLWGMGINIELKENDKLTLSKISADCPICNGKVKLFTNKNNQTIGICQKNSDHKFEFDFTLL